MDVCSCGVEPYARLDSTIDTRSFLGSNKQICEFALIEESYLASNGCCLMKHIKPKSPRARDSVNVPLLAPLFPRLVEHAKRKA